MKTAVIIPFYSNNVDRITAYQYTVDWWKSCYPEFEIIRGESFPFIKGVALQNAINQTDAECLIIADADSIIAPKENIQKAVDFISRTSRWFVPYDRVFRFTKEETNDYYFKSEHGFPDLKSKHETICAPYYPTLGGGIVILPRTLWDLVGGIDKRFVGWGGEDRSFGYALSTIHSHPIQMEGRLLHLWHPDQGPTQPMSRDTIDLAERYRKAYKNRQKMKILIDESVNK